MKETFLKPSQIFKCNHQSLHILAVKTVSALQIWDFCHDFLSGGFYHNTGVLSRHKKITQAKTIITADED